MIDDNDRRRQLARTLMESPMPTYFKACVSLAMLLLFADSTLAHGNPENAVFVAPGGVDSGRCQDAAAPCKSIAYALRWVGKGGQIRAAEGSYEISRAEDIVHLVSGAIDVRGGFRPDDRFRVPSGGPSTLVGVPQEYREFLGRRGFHLIADRKGMDRQVALEFENLLALHQSLDTSKSSVPCVDGSADGLACIGVDLLSHVVFADVSAKPGAAADVWGFVDLNTGREYVLVGYNIGTAVFDVTVAENPREVGFVSGPNTIWRDIKVYQAWNTLESRWDAFAYVTSDGTPEGLVVIDLTGLPHSIESASYSSDFATAHNVHVTATEFGTGLSLTNGMPALVIAGSNNGGGRYRSYSLADPAAPSFITLPSAANSGYMHDAASMIITDARTNTQCANAGSYCSVLFDFNEDSFDLWDVSVAASPVRLSSTDYANRQYVHSGWQSEDQQFLFVHDELDEQSFGLPTTLRVFSLADLRAPSPVGSWLGPTQAIDHNGFVRGNRYYMSNYSRGLSILDISDPRSPALIGHFDTYPASDGIGFVGAWGTFPFLHSGNIAISDVDSGLYMVADRTRDVAAGNLAFSRASYGGSEGSLLQIDVQRTGGTLGDVSVAYEFLPATGNTADISASRGILSWSDGDAGSKSIDLDLIADAAPESLERVLVKLIAPTGGATLAAGGIASVYIAEPATPASLGFAETSIDVAERGFATAVAVVERTGNAAGSVSVDYAVIEGTASPGVDFQGPTAGTLTWDDGDARPQWLEFVVIDDGVIGLARHFDLSIFNATGAGIAGASTLRVNIADGSGRNRAPVSVAESVVTAASGALVTLDGSRSSDPDGDALSYRWTQTAGTAVTLNDADQAIATFTAPTLSADSRLRFELVVSDPAGLSNTSTASVTVLKSITTSASGGNGGGATGWPMLIVLLTSAAVYRRMFRRSAT